MINTTKNCKLKNCLKSGNLAISRSYKKYFDFQSTINGSIDVDKCFKQEYPSDNRWDYLVLNNSEIEGYFVEIHPASTGEVFTMIAKKQWLIKEIIKQYYNNISNKRYKMVWIATNGIHITKNSSQMRKLIQHGLKPVSRLKM